jgi:diguanylate cyclase (GGDEF)-like protein/PAS domain S-box-containing protein
MMLENKKKVSPTDRRSERHPPEGLFQEPSGDGNAFRAMVEHLCIGVYRAAADDGGSFLYANGSMARMFGYRSTQDLLGLSICSLYGREEGRSFIDRVCNTESVKGMEFRLRKRDGETLWASCSARMSQDSCTGVRTIEGTIEDITEHRQMQEVLLKSERRLGEILRGSPAPTFVIDKNHRIIYWNRALENLVGIKAQEIAGTDQHWRIFHSSQKPCMVDLLIDGPPEKKKVRLCCQRKYTRSALLEDAYEAIDFFPALGEKGKWLRFTAAAVRDRRGEIFGAMETFEDITRHKETEKALRRSEKKYIELSITDDLTHLYNARHFFHQLGIEVGRVKRYGHPLSLLILDIDNFKYFNDSYGHVEGDRVLKRLGALIANHVRTTDTAFRYGGDEFAVILPETTGEEAASVAERIRKACESETFLPEFKEACIAISMGVAEHRPSESPMHLLNKADQNMYAVKKQGKNQLDGPGEENTSLNQKDPLTPSGLPAS